MRRCVFVAALAVALAGAASAQAKANDAAKEFTTVDLQGHRLRLSAYSHKVVLLNFWATWCTPCGQEMPAFIHWQSELGPKGFQVIGISMDDTATPVRKFTKELKVNYPVAMGTTRIARDYGGVLGLPVTILIGRDGRIVKRYEGAADLPAMEKEIRDLLER